MKPYKKSVERRRAYAAQLPPPAVLKAVPVVPDPVVPTPEDVLLLIPLKRPKVRSAPKAPPHGYRGVIQVPNALHDQPSTHWWLSPTRTAEPRRFRCFDPLT